ncbi:hypothetical protein LZG37_24930, partial [Halomonas titanicae]|uniref:hypothetical protein n=2 Tax=Vreelandella titanicae TaxID=664683 RepID=UPI001F46E16E
TTSSGRLLYALQNNVAQGLHAAPSGLDLGDITNRTTRLTEGASKKKQPHLIQPVSPPLYFCESLALLNSSLSYLGSSFIFRHGQSQSSAFNGGHFESALSLSWAGHFLLTEQSARVCTC